MIRKRLSAALSLAALLCLAPLLLTGCAGRVVPLEYFAAQVTPPRCSVPVAVLKMTDARSTTALGTNKDGQSFLADPSVPVADWVSYALYQELKANGCQAQYHTLPQDLEGTVITGEVQEVNLTQKDATSYKCSIKMRLKILKNGKEVMIQQFGGEIDKVYVPSSDNPKKTLTECLQVLMGEVMDTLLPKLKTL